MKPIIKVCDIETSISWYEHFLGFKCTFKNSTKNPGCAVLKNEYGELFMVQDHDQQSYASNLCLVEVDGLEKAYGFVQAKGCIIHQPIEKGFFGCDHFMIKDYEDNKIIYKKKD